METTELTTKIAKKVCDMIQDDATAEEIRKKYGIQANTFRHWITNSLLLPTSELDSPLLKLREALIARTLKDTAILGMLKAASEPSEHKSYKTTILSQFSKPDKALLESQGYAAFIKQVEVNAIILKVEETITSTAPDSSLFKEILKAISNNDTGTTQELTPFAPVHPDLPPV